MLISAVDVDVTKQMFRKSATAVIAVFGGVSNWQQSGRSVVTPIMFISLLPRHLLGGCGRRQCHGVGCCGGGVGGNGKQVAVAAVGGNIYCRQILFYIQNLSTNSSRMKFKLPSAKKSKIFPLFFSPRRPTPTDDDDDDDDRSSSGAPLFHMVASLRYPLRGYYCSYRKVRLVHELIDGSNYARLRTPR